MASFENVTDAIRRELDRIEGALVDTEPLMGVLAKMGRESARQAFVDQKLGSISWPERYPNQQDPFINVAGALSDFNEGKDPKPSRFQRRPALIDEGRRGGLLGSLAWETKGPFVATWGSNRPYASLHQEGGESTQPVTAAAKDRINRYLYGRKGKLKQGKAARGVDAKRSEFVDKLAPLLKKKELTTKVHKRPFLGITDALERDMISAVKEYFQKRNPKSGPRGGA